MTICNSVLSENVIICLDHPHFSQELILHISQKQLHAHVTKLYAGVEIWGTCWSSEGKSRRGVNVWAAAVYLALIHSFPSSASEDTGLTWKALAVFLLSSDPLLYCHTLWYRLRVSRVQGKWLCSFHLDFIPSHVLVEWLLPGKFFFRFQRD